MSVNWELDAAVVQNFKTLFAPGVEDAAVREMDTGVEVEVTVVAANRFVSEEVAVPWEVEYPSPNVIVSPTDLFTASTLVIVEEVLKMKTLSFSDAVGFSMIHWIG